MATRYSLLGEMIPRRVRRSFDHRAEPRIEPDSEHAVLEYGGERHHVTLVNISASGAMIDFQPTPHIGGRVCLEVLGQGRMEGFVRWVRGGRIGINFTPASS